MLAIWVATSEPSVKRENPVSRTSSKQNETSLNQLCTNQRGTNLATMKILLAIDESAFSDAAIQTVIRQSRPESAEVRVFHAVEWIDALPMSLRFGEGPTYDKDIVSLRDKSFQEGEQLVARAAQQLQTAGFRTSTTVVDGDPRHTILDCATEWLPDLIVMGSHGRKGLDRFLLGSVSETIMRHAACSVEIVRVPSSTAGKTLAGQD